MCELELYFISYLPTSFPFRFTFHSVFMGQYFYYTHTQASICLVGRVADLLFPSGAQTETLLEGFILTPRVSSKANRKLCCQLLCLTNTYRNICSFFSFFFTYLTTLNYTFDRCVFLNTLYSKKCTTVTSIIRIWFKWKLE